jgi:hypothetical protein
MAEREPARKYAKNIDKTKCFFDNIGQILFVLLHLRFTRFTSPLSLPACAVASVGRRSFPSPWQGEGTKGRGKVSKKNQTALQEIIVIAAERCQLCSVFIDFNQFMRYIYSINIDTMKGIACLESRKLSLK